MGTNKEQEIELHSDALNLQIISNGQDVDSNLSESFSKSNLSQINYEPSDDDLYLRAIETSSNASTQENKKLTKKEFFRHFSVQAFTMPLGLSAASGVWRLASYSKLSENEFNLQLIASVISWIFFSLSTFFFILYGFLYTLKIISYPNFVQKELASPVRLNIFFAPLITFMSLCISTLGFLRYQQLQNGGSTLALEESTAKTGFHIVFYLTSVAIIFLSTKVYRLWLFDVNYHFEKHAQPEYLMSTVSHFVLAVFGSSLGISSLPFLLSGVGLLFYSLVIIFSFKNLYATKSRLTLSLYMAPPAIACAGFSSIFSNFGPLSQLFFVLSISMLFLFFIDIWKLLRKDKLNLNSWAFSFPFLNLVNASIIAHNTPSESSDAFRSEEFKLFAWALLGIGTLYVVCLLAASIVRIIWQFCLLKDKFFHDPLNCIS